MSESERFKLEGNQYFSSKNFERAIESFTKAIELSDVPNHVLYSNRSACYASLKDFTNALNDAQECIKINDSWSKGYNRIGAAYLGLKNFDEAKKAYNKALELDPNNASAKEGLENIENMSSYNNLASDFSPEKMFSDPNLIERLRLNPKTSHLMNDPELVRKLLMIQSNPKDNFSQILSDPKLMTIMGVLMGIDIDSFNNLNNEYNQPNFENTQSSTFKTDEKPEETKPAEPAEPVDLNVLEANKEKQRGNDLYKQHKFDEAIEAYNKAWELNKDVTYLNNIGAAYYEKGDFDAAIDICEKAALEGRELTTEFKVIAKSFARIGNCYLKKDDLKKAVEYFEKALTEHRSRDVLDKLRLTQKEIRVREAKLYIDPEQAEINRLKGKEFFSKGDWPNAVKAYSEMVKRAPDNPIGYANRAAALIKLLSLPDAIKDCDEAIKLDPKFIKCYIRKSTAHIAMREYYEAVKVLEKAKEIDSKEGYKNFTEIDNLYRKAMSCRFQPNENETPEETIKRVSKDPEVVKILLDPVIQSILNQAKENPSSLQEHMKNPEIYNKINLLIAAGVIRTR